GLALIRDEKTSLKGFINTKGETVIPPKFRMAEPFCEGMARVSDGGADPKWGFIDRTGKTVIPVIYNSADDFSEGLAAVTEAGGKTGFIDKEGNWMIAPKYENSESFVEGLAVVKAGDRWGYIDRQGEFRIPPAYGRASSFSEGLAAANISGPGLPAGGKWGFIDRSGKVAVDFSLYSSVGDFHEGYAYFSVKHETVEPFSFYKAIFGGRRKHSQTLYGYINKKGETVIEPIFCGAEDFSEGLACVMTERDVYDQWYRYGYIDRNGKTVIPGVFTVASSFSNGLTETIHEDYGIVYIDKTGKIVWPKGELKTSLFY
ncbi:MAG: WG repeat-containing protein, partial [Desulfobacterales bacterium]|nr:WG repeat-containing protein [Desulfobacterales bacterium]